VSGVAYLPTRWSANLAPRKSVPSWDRLAAVLLPARPADRSSAGRHRRHHATNATRTDRGSRHPGPLSRSGEPGWQAARRYAYAGSTERLSSGLETYFAARLSETVRTQTQLHATQRYWNNAVLKSRAEPSTPRTQTPTHPNRNRPHAT